MYPMYPVKENPPASQLNPRDAVELIDRLIQLHCQNTCNIKAEEIELIKRELTDYFLATDPRKGVYFTPGYPTQTFT